MHNADAEHAVTPVRSGYRAALIYSICWPRHVPTITLPTSRWAQEALRDLAAESTEFVYFMQHEYTARSLTQLGAAALKGTDRARVGQLVNNNRAINPGYTFHLAQAERSNTGHEEDQDCFRFDSAPTD